MTTVLRCPLTTRQPESPWPSKVASPTACPSRQATLSTSTKRPRSPDVTESNNTKRAKSTLSHTLSPATALAGENDTQPATQNATTSRDVRERKDKLRQREEREQANREFLTRYTKAFPSFVFYFDGRDASRQHAESRVLALGASIEHFFSAAVTHVITNCPQPPKNEQCDLSNKENAVPKRSVNKESTLRSPIQLKTRLHDHGGYDKLVRDAVQLHKKIWSVSKLENILSRLIPSNGASSKTKSSQRSTQLNQLLHRERVHGTTSERDPRERRHDYHYFSKQSHFFLVEDIRGELAPVAIIEYIGSTRSVEKDRAPSYPILYMDHRSRGPFVKYDEKEARRQNKVETAEKLKDIERDKLRAKVSRQLKQQHDEKRRKFKGLRRCASMSQLGRHVVTRADSVNLDLDESQSTIGLSNSHGLVGETTTLELVASGFGHSTTGQSTGNGYLAASGNSVQITSTTTTSLARGLGSSLRLPPSLREQLARQVVTNRRLENVNGKENSNPYAGESRLRKAKSTTTMRLPTREENKKPGYCEACRIKFEDFKDHVHGSRHRKFARNENNYIDLDFLLGRLERKLNVDDSEVASSQIEIKVEDEASDACLGPGDYFYVSPKTEGDWDEEETADGQPHMVNEEDALM